MSTFYYYFLQLTALLWIPLAILSAIAFHRRPSPGTFLISTGAFLLAVVYSLSVFFPFYTEFDEKGDVMSEVPGLIPVELQVMSGTVGLLLITAGAAFIVATLEKQNLSNREDR